MTANTGQGPTTDSPEPLTIKEIARLAGVSIGTVDRVLHNRGRVSAENVAKIQSLVADRGYQPNLFASRLSAGEVRTVGVVIPRADQDFGYWKLIVDGMEKAARELRPLRLHVRFEPFDRQSPDSLAAAVRAVGGADGLAVAPIHVHALKPLVDGLPAATPLVFFDTDMECRRTRCFVGQDPWTGGAVAARLLGLAAGREAALGVVRFDEDDEHLQLRSQAFAETARAAGAAVHVLGQKLSAPLSVRLDEARRFAASHGIGGLFVPNASVGEYAAAGTRLAGYDLTPDNRAALEDGRVDFLLSQRPEVMGYEAVFRLGRALLFREELPRRIAMPLDIILKENLAGHLERR